MHQTNNHMEAWHRKLNCAFQCKHPTLWTFLDKLMKEENSIYPDMINAMSGSQPPKRKKRLHKPMVIQFGSKFTYRHQRSVKIHRTFIIFVVSCLCFVVVHLLLLLLKNICLYLMQIYTSQHFYEQVSKLIYCLVFIC